MTSTIWWQGPKPSCSRAIFVDIVPVRPNPEPMIFSPIRVGPSAGVSRNLLKREIRLANDSLVHKRKVFSGHEGDSASPDRPEPSRGVRGADVRRERGRGGGDARKDTFGNQPCARPVARPGR